MEEGIPRHGSENAACLMPLCLVEGNHITTVEGISDGTNPHAVHSRLAELHGSQCGFCTPGFIVSLSFAALVEQKHTCDPALTARQLGDAVGGNFCRCTGYRPIFDAAKSLGTLSSDEVAACCSSSEGRGARSGGAEDHGYVLGQILAPCLYIHI
jgi:xanthine dehydrogenase iron-sulfur cluster and FAD-binding subunit A